MFCHSIKKVTNIAVMFIYGVLAVSWVVSLRMKFGCGLGICTDRVPVCGKALLAAHLEIQPFCHWSGGNWVRASLTHLLALVGMDHQGPGW